MPTAGGCSGGDQGRADQECRPWRTTIAASSFRAIENLLASWKCRPTSRVGSQPVQNASGMPNRGSIRSISIDPKSWLSTQVYTRIGRAAVFEIFFSEFLKS